MWATSGADFIEVGTVGPTYHSSAYFNRQLRDEFFRVYAFNAAGDSPDSNIAC